MRVTDSMIFDSAALYAGRAREQMEAAAAESSTGLKLRSAADDPAAAAMVVSHDASAARLTGILDGVAASTNRLQTADGALQSVSNLLARAKELAVQMGSDSLDADNRAAGATEVKQLIAEAVVALNTKDGSHYLFGGTRTDAPPFDPAGTYQGNAGVQRIEVAPGVTQQISVDASAGLAGVGGGTDVIGNLQKLSTALSGNDAAGVRALLGALDTSVAQVAGVRAQVGSQIGGLDAAAAAGRVARDDERKQSSHLTDADVVDSATRLALAQRGLEAAISAAAQSFKLTLLGKL